MDTIIGDSYDWHMPSPTTSKISTLEKFVSASLAMVFAITLLAISGRMIFWGVTHNDSFLVGCGVVFAAAISIGTILSFRQKNTTPGNPPAGSPEWLEWTPLAGYPWRSRKMVTTADGSVRTTTSISEWAGVLINGLGCFFLMFLGIGRQHGQAILWGEIGMVILAVAVYGCSIFDLFRRTFFGLVFDVKSQMCRHLGVKRKDIPFSDVHGAQIIRIGALSGFVYQLALVLNDQSRILITKNNDLAKIEVEARRLSIVLGNVPVWKQVP